MKELRTTQFEDRGEGGQFGQKASAEISESEIELWIGKLSGSKLWTGCTVTVAVSANKAMATAIWSSRVMVSENQRSRSFRRLTERTKRRVLVLWDGTYLGSGAAEEMLGV